MLHYWLKVEPKPIITHCHMFSYALHQLHVITSSFEWFTVFSLSFVTSYFGFGFASLNSECFDLRLQCKTV